MSKNCGDKFLSVLDGSWGYLSNSAQIELESNREACIRRPRSLPLESDLQTLRTYVMTIFVLVSRNSRWLHLYCATYCRQPQ